MEFIDAKAILIKANYSDWFGVDYNMNLYKGCNHGCIYCDSRSDCYHIDDFDTVRGKKDAINILENELKRKKNKGVVCLGAMSDPYNPFEKEYKITRRALKLINRYEFGVCIATKSDLILRDIDILKKIKKQSPVIVKMTITSVDDEISKKIEANVCVSSKRFSVIKELNRAGIYSGILMMPILPFIEDTDESILGIVEKAAKSSARFIYPSFGVTLRSNQRIWFLNKIEEEFPGMKNKYINAFGNDYSCNSKRSAELFEMFSKACNEVGIKYKMKDIIKEYKSGYESKQISMF